MLQSSNKTSQKIFLQFSRACEKIWFGPISCDSLEHTLVKVKTQWKLQTGLIWFYLRSYICKNKLHLFNFGDFMINLVCFVKNLGNSSVTQNKQNQFQELFTQVFSSILTLVPFSFRSPYFSSKKLHFFLIIVFQSITKTNTFHKIDNIIYFH